MQGTVELMRTRLGDEVHERAVWSSIKRRFDEMIDPLPDSEFPKTFFSSVTRKTFGTVGVDPAVEFIALDLDPLGNVRSHVETKVYANRGDIDLLAEELLADFSFRTPWRDFERSVKMIADEVKALVNSGKERRAIESIEVIKEVFYQMTRAYLVGRINGRGWTMPFVVSLRNGDSGVVVDAIMLEEGTVSVLFSFTRSYFHVDLAHVGEVVKFLTTILPRKRVSELFTVLGRAKQGKTERYRELFSHLQQSDRQLRAGAGRARPGDDLLHAAVVRRRLQADPRQVPVPEEHPARGRAVQVRAGVQARPRRPAGRRAGIQAYQVPEGALLAGTARGTAEGSRAHRPLRGRRRHHRSPLHRAAHDAAQPLPALGRARRWPRRR